MIFQQKLMEMFYSHFLLIVIFSIALYYVGKGLQKIMHSCTLKNISFKSIPNVAKTLK